MQSEIYIYIKNIASIAYWLHVSGIAGKWFRTTSSSTVPSCKPIVSVGLFSRFIIASSA